MTPGTSLLVHGRARIGTQLRELAHSFQPNENHTHLKSEEEGLYNSRYWRYLTPVARYF